MAPLQTWEATCAKKRWERESQIPEIWRLPQSIESYGLNVLDVPNKCGILTPDEIRITSDYDAFDIVQLIKKGELSSEAVTIAFCKRAAIAQQLVNCLTEIFFDEAIERARSLDKARKAHPGRPLPPFFGLPISIKDSFKLVGKDSTIGLTCFVGQPATQNSPLVDILLELGAVLYCKTNVPQTMMSAESHNNIFGRTVNPSHRNLGSGGSSGGEGALIAMRGSLLGVGTDIAGSIRIPAACCGVYGFKPSAHLIPYGGQQSPSVGGSPGISPCAGPLATSMRACAWFMETVRRAEPWKYDAMSLRVPWVNDPKESGKPLRLGFATNDGCYTPSPPLERAMAQSLTRLAFAGVTLIPISLPDVKDIIDDTWSLFALDGAEYMSSLIQSSGEPVIPSLIRSGLLATPAKSIQEVCALNRLRLARRAKYNDIFNDNELDGLLMPPAAHTAMPHEQWGPVNYTALWNYLDFPACILPVCKVKAKDVKQRDAVFGTQDQSLYNLYTGPEAYNNAPISIQLVGQALDDQRLAVTAQRVSNILKC